MLINPLQEIASWNKITVTDDWIYFLRLLAKHRENLKNKAVVCANAGEHDSAMRYAARAKEPEVIIKMINKRQEQLREKGET